MSGAVCEGIDGSGKTTLAKTIQRKLGWPLTHVAQPGNPDIEQMIRLVESSPLVFDRFHLSPVVYGQYFRGGPDYHEFDLWALEGLLQARGYVLVVCRTDASIAANNNLKVEQLYDRLRDEATLVDLMKSYDQTIVQHSTLPTLYYDFRVDPTGSQALEFIDKETRCPLPYGMLGTERPEIWLVGDERKRPGDLFEATPFYLPGIGDKLVGGTLLWRSLSKLAWDWGKIALSNSKTLDLRYVYDRLNQPRRVIALGNNAEKRLKEAKVSHVKTPHPQWVRRFKHHQAVELMVDQLRGASS